MEKGIARWAPLTGLAALLLGGLSFVLMETWVDTPGSKASGTELAAWYTDNGWEIIIMGWVWLLAAAALLWFMGSLRSVLRRAEAGSGRVASIAWAGGVIASAVAALAAGPDLSAAGFAEFDDRVISPEAADALFMLSNGAGVFFAFEIMIGVLAVASAVVVLRTGVFPKWWGWLSLLWGIWMLIIPIGWFGIIGFPIWLLLTTFFVWNAESRSGAGTTA